MRSRNSNRKLRLESLESRRLFAATGITSAAEDQSFPNIASIVYGDNQHFFARQTPEYGSELWISVPSDQTFEPIDEPLEPSPDGHWDTHLVSDLIPGPGGSNPRHLTVHGGRVYFSADMNEFGSASETYADRQLWVSDGTTAGTRRLTQFGGVAEGVSAFGSNGTGNADEHFTTISSGLVFGVWTPANEFQLWLQPFDDTPAFELSSEAEGSLDVVSLQTTPNHIVFGQTTFGGESLLWLSDGTPAGTQRVSGYPTDFELPFASQWSETDDGLVTISKHSVGLPYEVWRIAANGTFSKLSGEGVDPNDPSSVEVSLLTESESSQLLKVGDSLWWRQRLGAEFHPVNDPIRLAPGIVQISDVDGPAYWAIAPPADDEQASPAEVPRRAIQRTDRSTLATVTTELPDAITGSELHVLGSRLIYQSLFDGNRTLVAVDVVSGDVQTLEILTDMDQLSVDVVSTATLIYRVERLGASLIARLEAGAIPGQPLVRHQLLNEPTLPSRHQVFGDHLLTYVSTSESFMLTRVDVLTGEKEILLTGQAPDTRLIFDTMDALFYTAAVPFRDGSVVYQVHSPLGRDELWLFRNGQHSFVTRLPEGSVLPPFTGNYPLIATPVDRSVIYFIVGGIRSGVLRISQSDVQSEIPQTQFIESNNPSSISMVGDAVRFVSDSVIYQWDNGSDAPISLDRQWDPSMIIRLSNGAAFAATPGSYLQTVVVERPGETRLQTFIGSDFDTSSSFIYRLTDGWIARTIARDYVSQSWWYWGDDEIEPRLLDGPPAIPGAVRYDIIGATFNHVLVRVSDQEWGTLDVFALNESGVHSFFDTVDGEVSIRSVEFGGVVDRDPILISQLSGNLEPTTLRWDIDDQSVHRPLRPADESSSQSVVALGDQLLLLRSTQRLLVSSNESEPSFHNSRLPEDVNSDGLVTALDALAIINWLNRDDESSHGETAFFAESLSLPDVSGDDRVTALDALMVINRLNERSSSGEPDATHSRYDDQTPSWWFSVPDMPNHRDLNPLRRDNTVNAPDEFGRLF